uniref:Uncharacterized protein n=1 Tax=Quercus lobata TaxID=97700 RepID=A0A7N2LCR4_QUELO
MAGSSNEEEMESVLLPNFDLIYQDFKNAIAEIELLKSNSNAELKIREALQFTSHSLRQGHINRISILFTAFCLSYCLKEELKRVSDERLHQEYEHRKAMDLLNRDYMTKVGDLEAQIQGLLLEKATNEATINLLRQDLTAHKTHVQTLAKRLDRVHFDVESKYDLEIQDLKDCLMIEQEEKNELSRKIQELEKELLISRTKLVEQQRDTVSSRLVETLKLKIMKLRKENEILRRQLPCSEDGLRDGI